MPGRAVGDDQAAGDSWDCDQAAGGGGGGGGVYNIQLSEIFNR